MHGFGFCVMMVSRRLWSFQGVFPMDGFRIFVLCMFAFGAAVCGAVSVFYVFLACRQRRFSRRAAGRVVSVKPYRTHDRLTDGRTVDARRYSCTLEATIAGMRMRVKVDSGKPLAQGSSVMFWYDPEHPRATLLRKSRHTYVPWTVLCIFCTVAVAFIFMFWH